MLRTCPVAMCCGPMMRKHCPLEFMIVLWESTGHVGRLYMAVSVLYWRWTSDVLIWKLLITVLLCRKAILMVFSLHEKKKYLNHVHQVPHTTLA